MARGIKDLSRVRDMYSLYETGVSLAEVAAVYGIGRKAVFVLFKRHGFRTRPHKFLKVVEFNGRKYTQKPDGYFRSTDDPRTFLHRDMWAFYFGIIPAGLDIHHKDGDKSHNAPENFELMSRSDHMKLHHAEKTGCASVLQIYYLRNKCTALCD